MKNRSKILSPRVTQIRRELSNSAEYAATGFSGMCSSAKSQFKKVISKISGACSTALNLFFQNPEISYQPREVYSFHMKLDSISNTINSPLPGPKPFHSDSYTMPPTPGRFLTEEELSNKKEKTFKPEPRAEIIKKPEYGVPVWKQLGSMSKEKTEISSNEKKKKHEESEELKRSFGTRSGEAGGSAGQKKVRENPNSTPIRSFHDDGRGGVRSAGSEPDKKTPAFCEANATKVYSEGKDLYNELGMELNKEGFQENSKIHVMENKLNKETKIDSGKNFAQDKDLDTFSFMDQNEKRDSQAAEEFEVGNDLENKVDWTSKIKEMDGCGNKDKVDDNSCGKDGIGSSLTGKGSDGAGIQRKEEIGSKVGSTSNAVKNFFVPSDQKKVVVMEEGFINSNSTSKTSSPSKLSESDKDKNENQSKNSDKNAESVKPDQISNISSKNPFLPESNPKGPEKQVYVFGSSSNPFVTRPNASTSAFNPFVPKSDLSPSEIKLAQNNPKPSNIATPYDINPFKSEAKPNSTSNSDGKLNPFSQSNPRNVANPFAQDPFTGHSSAPSSGSKMQNTYTQNTFNQGSNPFSSSQASNSNPFSTASILNPIHHQASVIPNPFRSSSSAIPNTFDSISQKSSSTYPTQPLSSSNVSLKQFQAMKNNENRENPFNSEPSLGPKSAIGIPKKNDSASNSEKGKLVNPFVLPNLADNRKDGEEKNAFSIGVLPKRDNVGGSRNFK